ncbi:MAG: hypothetical protein JNM08_09050 [Rubrivivax sp.]|nr:hypothetical protein [Rubrivivax sp.]
MSSLPDTAARAAPHPQRRPLAWAGQVLLYGLFALAIGVFSQWPPYHPLQAGQALVKLSISKVGKPVGDCRTLGDAELARLPPNMRTPTRCPRERSSLVVALDIDGKRVLQREAPATGLSHDGMATVYERLVVPAGERRIAVHLSDDVRARDAGYRREATLSLVPGQVLVIDFDAGKGGITFQ